MTDFLRWPIDLVVDLYGAWRAARSDQVICRERHLGYYWLQHRGHKPRTTWRVLREMRGRA